MADEKLHTQLSHRHFATSRSEMGIIMKGWMKEENTMIACCSDGTRPVINAAFEIAHGTGEENINARTVSKHGRRKLYEQFVNT